MRGLLVQVEGSGSGVGLSQKARWGDGSGVEGVKRQRGKRWDGGCKGAKGQTKPFCNLRLGLERE